MKNWSIDNKLWLAILTPSTLACLLLGTVAFFSLSRTLEENFLSRGELISLQLRASFNQADEQEQSLLLANLLADFPTLKSIRLYDHNGRMQSGLGPQSQIEFDLSTMLMDAIPTTLHHNQTLATFFSVRISAAGTTGWALLEFDRSALQTQKFRLSVNTALIVALIWIIVALIFALLKRHLVRPFATLRQNLELLSHGDIEKISTHQQGQPFDLLQDYLKRIADQIRGSRLELQETVEQTTADLRQTLETVEEQNIELNLARKQAMAANKAKTEFLSNTSHEIRTPINGILGYVQLLLKGELSQQQQDYLRNIEKSSQGLLTVINNILDVAKIETGQVVLDYVPFSLEEVLNDSVALFSESAKQKNLSLRFTLDNQVPTALLGDPLRLKQILANLVGNAVKFSHRGEIVMSVSLATNIRHTQDERVELKFSVQDQGRGIDKPAQQQLFQLFSQVDASDSRDQGGTGLGLAVSKGLVDLMQGRIGVESELGKGSTFWFRASFGRDRSALMQHRPIAQRKAQFDAHILAVDDTPANLHLLAELLKDFGVRVTQAKDGIEALRQCEQSEFELIFMDIQMPVIDGLETTRRIRAMEKAPRRTPIVALTAHAMTDQKTELLLAGMDDYLSKPINETQLNHVLLRWVGDKVQTTATTQQTSYPEQVQTNEVESSATTSAKTSNNPVDIGLSLKLSNQKPDLARDMLQMLVNDLPNQKQSIETHLQNENLTELETVVHKIRGGASYCGVPNLQQTSSEADELLRRQQFEPDAIQDLLTAIDELLVWAEAMDIDALFDMDTAV